MKFYSFILFAAMAAVALSSEYKDDHYGSDKYGDPYHAYGGSKCDPPKRPQYGGYDGSYDDYYEIGHRVTYYCDDGYDLYGPKYSTCSYSTSDNRGYWDDDTPYCRRNQQCEVLWEFTICLFSLQKAVSQARGPRQWSRETDWDISGRWSLLHMWQRI